MSARKMPTLEYAEEMSSRASHASDAEGDDGKETFGFSENSHEYELQDIIDSHWFSEGRDSKRNSKRHSKLGRLGSGSLVKLGSTVSLGKLGSTASLGRLGSAVNLGKLGSTVNLGQSGAAAPSDTKWYSRKDKGRERLKDEDEDEDGSGSDETKVDEKKTEDDTKAVGIFKLFRFGTPLELTMNVFGLVLAAAAGSAQPLMTLFFGNITKAFTEYGATVHTITTGGGGEDMTAELAAAKAHVKHDSARIALWITLIGVGHFVCTYTYMLIWNWTSERQSARLRAAYLKAVLRQEVEYLDHLGAGEVASRIQSDTLLFQIGIGEKMALAVGYVSTFFTGFILAYIRSPRMGGALTSVLPPVVIIGVVMDVSMAYYTGKVLKLTSKAATLAEEALSTIRTVHAFGISERLGKRFDTLVETARKVGNTNSNIEGTSIALIYFSIYGAYGLAFYYGGVLYLQGKADVSIVINVLLAVVIGSFTLSLITPELQAISRAQAAAGKLFAVIDHVPSIDSASEQGLRLPSVVGDITLEDVHFTYPSRPTIPILKGISLHMEAGKTHALVGASGSGKSTIIQLLERFYDPDRGHLTLDGHDLRTLNVRWLRQQLGLVSQEPTLFSTTVRGNVEQGLVGTPYEFAPDAERLRLVQRACITANAHDFITNLPDGYDTHVGERGMLLSGGQKQRVAIARAIIANPRILLLDEATSALDATAERIVQDALENASRGRTTIIIAHRLSTIKDADCILVMSAGEIIERGTHTELLARQGAYATLVANQKVAGDMKDESADVTPGDLTPSGQHLTGGPSKADLLRLQSTLSLGLHEDKEKRIGFARLFIRLIKLGRGRYLWYFSGLVGAICVGVSYAAVAILFGKSIADFEGTDKFAVKKALSKKGLWYLVVALSTCFVAFFQNTPFSNMGWNTSSKLRSMSFRSLMRHDIQWFDEHEAGPATASLSEDPQKVQGLFGMTLGQIIGAMATIVSGMIVGLAYAPILAAVGIACMPLIFSAGYIRLRVVDLKDQRARKIYSKSTLLATEAAGAIRTIASLTREKDVLATYVESLRDAEKTSIRLAWGSQALFASSQAVSYFSIALVFWAGSIWLADGKFTSEKFFICIEAVIFATIQAGSMFMFVPDASRAGSASRALFKILDNQPTVDSDSKDGIIVDPKQVRGDMRFNNVTFRYPSRPGVRVLKHLSLEIPAGKYVALVGPSGCGKSTTIQLIERFYDPLGGSITLDGTDIRKLNVRSYRSAIALVSQEPTLYSGNIRFNILLGAIDPDAITEQQLVQACKDANIYEFIMSLPNGFETEVGGKGVQLSGGQKQRLAIARALIRNPRVLLLDEATAALDSASERIVQAALDNASEGRSVLAIAHRLSTIQNADIIYYISEGDVLEKGTHQELLALRGAYYELVQMQALVHT